ncbi:MFS transporter [Companilactobacillus nantensis]|uniref:Major facilitator superfamily permease n=1 Tax=Companilactobacillus nantensis DSM 16982 TaxID=1423774 RepID=A0A0R1WJD3_9LACO|nr:MFS transporter [Companilactobacillus nantensis]KRM15062.1 major facilitator superfamily permease [Companilactobacillus nantensis DSM 16982]GEO63305.1 MFS transporter [Companilactobacillus nantensis]
MQNSLDRQNIENSKRITLGILSISFLMSVSNAISGTIPLMQKYFSNVSSSNIELLVVIPTGGVLLGTVISGAIGNVIGKKYTVLLGLTIALITGVLPAFWANYFTILLSRAMFGVGCGIFTPLSVSYITDTFSKEKCHRLLGYRNAIGAIGDSIMLFIAGFLIKFSWNTTYLVFFFLLIPIILIIFFVPKELDNFEAITDENGETEVVEKTSNVKPSTNLKVIKLAAIFLFMCMFYSAISLKFANYVVQNKIGTAATATYIFGFLTLCSIFSGLLFDKISKILGKWTVVIFEVVTAGAMVALTLSTSIPVLLVLILICGFSNGIINPALTARMVDYSPENSMNLTTSIIIIGINIGFLVAPYAFQLIATVFGNATPQFIILVSGLFYIALALYDVYTVKRDRLTL